MTRIILPSVIALACFFCKAQTCDWPVVKQAVGEGIISQPQQYIDGNLNYEELYITAPFGDTVVAPISGIIVDLFVAEKITRFDIKCWDIRKGSFNQCISDILASKEAISIQPIFLSGHMSIKTNEGNYVHIGGLLGHKEFSTGMYIEKGTSIGVVGYDYKSFNIPNISISIRNKEMDPIDPMKPFGLSSKFIPLRETAHPVKLTHNQAQEDINILFDAYEECYPMLHERISKERFESYRDSTIASMADVVDYYHFYYTVKATTTRRLINDSHLSLLTTIPTLSSNFLVPRYRLGVCDNSLVITSVPFGEEDLLGKKVKSVNGMNSHTWIERLKDNLSLFDGDAIESKCNMELDGWNYVYGEEVHRMKSQHLILSNNEEIYDKWVVNNTIKRSPSNFDFVSYMNNIKRSQLENYSFKFLSDSVMLFTLNSFSLGEEEIGEIENNILLPQAGTYLIIDLRNNPGGDEIVMGRLLSLFLETPISGIHPYEIVNDTCSYKSFQYSGNYPVGTKPFSDYTFDLQEGGYIKESLWPQKISAKRDKRFSGDILLLIGEKTYSAATLFASYLVRAGRAIAIGRETPSGYHQMTASKFIDLRLPNSKIDVRIPLVRCVFDVEETERTPSDRGLLPDYCVPFSFDECYISSNDIILDKAMDVIRSGTNMQPPYFLQNNKNEYNTICQIILVSLLCVLILAIPFMKRRNQ